jgi:hypothetical protein
LSEQLQVGARSTAAVEDACVFKTMGGPAKERDDKPAESLKPEMPRLSTRGRANELVHLGIVSLALEAILHA